MAYTTYVINLRESRFVINHQLIPVLLFVLLIPCKLMRSQWFEYKQQAIDLRQQGFSYGEIQSALSIPKSTLSHWLRNIELTGEQRARLDKNYGDGLIKARAKSVKVRRDQKIARIQTAKDDAQQIFDRIDLDKDTVELALAMLYMGEGAKTNKTAMGNSNSLILKFFLTVLLKQYRLDLSKIRFDLHVRYDQDANVIKKYWSKELNVPIEHFKYVVADRRTEGRPTRPDYHGVCLIDCGNVAIQRRLIHLYNLFSQRIVDDFYAGD